MSNSWLAAGRKSVDVGVGVHHRSSSSHANRHLEGRQDEVLELAATHGDGGVVAAGLGGGVPGEVLQRGDHAGALQTLDVGRAQRADDIGVLAHGLLDAAPAVVADHVQQRREALVDAHRLHVRADGLCHLLDELRVEGGAPGHGGRDRRSRRRVVKPVRHSS